jgi:hypothetical protein
MIVIEKCSVQVDNVIEFLITSVFRRGCAKLFKMFILTIALQMMMEFFRYPFRSMHLTATERMCCSFHVVV